MGLRRWQGEAQCCRPSECRHLVGVLGHQQEQLQDVVFGQARQQLLVQAGPVVPTAACALPYSFCQHRQASGRSGEQLEQGGALCRQ